MFYLYTNLLKVCKVNLLRLTYLIEVIVALAFA